jgi:hypothetical protein
MNQDDINMPVAKVVSLWTLIGITSWTEAAAFAGFMYSLLLIGEWLWKRIFRKLAERQGWVKPRKTPDTDMGAL